LRGDLIIMERKLNVLIVENSAEISKRLIDNYDKLNGLAEIVYASTAEKAFDAILSQHADVIVWGIELGTEHSSTLSEIRKGNKKLFLIILQDYSDQDFKHTDNCMADAFFKMQKLKDLPELILQLAYCKPANSNFYTHSQTYSDKFLKDPLF